MTAASPDGRLQGLAEGNKLFDVVQGAAIHPVDEKHPLMAFLKEEKAQTEVFPLVNNFDPVSNQWLTSIGELLNDAAARAALRRNLLTFLASDNYHGLSLDLEEIPEPAQPGEPHDFTQVCGCVREPAGSESGKSLERGPQFYVESGDWRFRGGRAR